MTELRLTSALLRGWRHDDAESLARHANNPNVARNLRDAFPSPYGMDDAREFLARRVGEDPPTNFAIEVDGEAAGGIGIRFHDDIERGVGEIGYWLSEVHWGCGITTEAIVAVTEYAWRTFPLDRIEAVPFARNAASARVLTKAGYALEGRRTHRVRKGAELLDDLVYVALRATSSAR